MSARLVIAALLLASGLGLVPRQAALPSISDAEFGRLIQEFSERGGSFHADNFVSNETAIADAILLLSERNLPRGAYVGVGPEQNFSYIVSLQPQLAFIVDIRRDNLLEHLLYKAVAELSTDRGDFLSRLFSRPRPAEATPDAELPSMLLAFQKARPTQPLFDKNFADVLANLKGQHRLPLNGADERGIKAIYGQFRSVGPSLTYVGQSSRWPTFAEVVTSTDRGGVGRTFLSTEERFQIFKSYEARNLIIPVVGDFAGPKALRAVGAYLRELGMPVSAFYTSNVEQYLFGGGPSAGPWKAFYENARTLPIEPGSVFIRSFPAGAVPATNVPGASLGASTISISPIAQILTAVNEKKISSYSDLAAIGGVGGQGSDQDLVRLFESYASGRPVALTAGDPMSLRRRFKAVAQQWIASASPGEVARRERVVAVAALEIAHDALEREERTWDELKWIVEWACDQLRFKPKSAFEQEWMLASIALGAKAGDARFLAIGPNSKCRTKDPCNQARHAEWRFPEDRRFTLGAWLAKPALRVVSNRPDVALEILVSTPSLDSPELRKRAFEDLDETLNGLDALTADPVAGPEARLRAGVLRFNLSSLPRALVDFRSVVATARDPELVYLAHIFSGLAHDALDRPDAAIAEFRAALQVFPGGRAAATALATHLVAQDHTAEALALVDGTFTSDPPDDPWYRFVDLHWPAAIARLRAAVRR